MLLSTYILIGGAVSCIWFVIGVFVLAILTLPDPKSLKQEILLSIVLGPFAMVMLIVNKMFELFRNIYGD